VGEESLGSPPGQLEQGCLSRAAGAADGALNSPAFRLLGAVWDAGNALRELVGTLPGKDRVGVRVHQAGNHAGALDVEKVAIEPDRTLQISFRPQPYDDPITRGQRTILDAPEWVLRRRHHGGQLACTPKDKIRRDHVARSIPWVPAKSTALW
jgi:hypothetical protein